MAIEGSQAPASKRQGRGEEPEGKEQDRLGRQGIALEQMADQSQATTLGHRHSGPEQVGRNGQQD
jgi:hypothetical protein